MLVHVRRGLEMGSPTPLVASWNDMTTPDLQDGRRTDASKTGPPCLRVGRSIHLAETSPIIRLFEEGHPL